MLAYTLPKRLFMSVVTTTAKRGLFFAGLMAASMVSATSKAEPPLMNEQSVKPKIEAKSPDGKNSVALGGFVQARYTESVADKADDTSQFGVPRTRLYTFGHVYSEDFRYRLMVGTPPFSQQLQVFDAYLEYKVVNELRLRAGRFKIPVFREWVESARLLASVERSSLAIMLLPGRDYGLMTSGSLGSGVFDYAFAVFNGAGDIATKESNSSPAAAGRIVWNTTGRPIEGEIDFKKSPIALSLGASASSTWRPKDPAAQPEPKAPHLMEQLGGFEMAFRYRGFDLSGEIMGRRRDDKGKETTVLGGYVRLDQYFKPIKSALGAKAVRIVGLDEPKLTQTEGDIHFAHFVDEHDLKIVFSVGLRRRDQDKSLEQTGAVQAQVAF